MIAADRLDRLNLILIRNVSWKWLLLLLLLILPFNLFLFPARTARLTQLSGLSDPILDVKFAYNPEEVFSTLEALGEQGRLIYALSELTLDLLYPVLYNLFMVSILVMLIGSLTPRTRMQRLVLAPLLIWIADYGENILLVILLLTYPQEIRLLAYSAGFFSTLKWILAALVILLIMVLLGIYLTRKILPRLARL